MKNAVRSNARIALLVLAFVMNDAGLAAEEAPSGLRDARAGYLAGVRGDYGPATALLTRAIESGGLSAPALASAYINRGVVLRRLGLIGAAIDDYTQALQLHQYSALALSNRGLALAKWGRYDEAIRDLERAIAIEPSDAKLFLIRGNAHFDKGAFADAVEDYDRALRINPNFREAQINRRDAQDRLQHPSRPCTCSQALATTEDTP